MKKTIIIFLIAFALLSCEKKEVPKVDYDRKADQRLLFIGNSYVYYFHLNKIVEQLVSRLEKKEVFGAGISAPSAKSFDHLRNIWNEESDLHKVFVTDAHQGKKWDLLVLQEYSQIPPLLEEAGTQSEMDEVYFFGEKVAKKTMLLMTPGYANGDPSHPLLPNYLAMQERTERGTRKIARQMAQKGGTVIIAPAGLAFKTVYEDVQKEGGNPLAENSRFRQLYIKGYRYPNLAGTYLMACVIVAMYTEKSILEVDDKPKGLDAGFAKYLREVAARVVENEKRLNNAN